DQPVEQAGDKQRQGTRHAGALFRFPLEFEQEYFGSAMSFDGAAVGSESKPLTLHVVVEAQVRLVGAGGAQMVSGPGKQGVVAAQQKLSATSEPCNLRLLPHKLCKGGCHVAAHRHAGADGFPRSPDRLTGGYWLVAEVTDSQMFYQLFLPCG